MATEQSVMDGVLRQANARRGERIEPFEGPDGNLIYCWCMPAYNGKGKWRVVYAHDLVWESVFGPVAAGYRVSHKDGDPKNLALANLELVPLD